MEQLAAWVNERGRAERAMVALQRGGNPKRRSEPDAGPQIEIIPIPEVPEVVPRRLDVIAEQSLRRDGEARTPGATTFDFGPGAVRAARHRNPDGSEGGWVAHTAHVDATSHIDPDAVVFDNARVANAARILDQARIAGSAQIDEATISGSAVVAGEAVVRRATVTDHAKVREGGAVWDGATIAERARVDGRAHVVGPAVVDGDARIRGDAWVRGGHVGGAASVAGSASVAEGADIVGEVALTAGRHPEASDPAAAPVVPTAPRTRPSRRTF
jgi:UDP-3-O-[3-hydroxymyristoyl] glucosamine N-acyltransferase